MIAFFYMHWYNSTGNEVLPWFFLNRSYADDFYIYTGICVDCHHFLCQRVEKHGATFAKIMPQEEKWKRKFTKAAKIYLSTHFSQ